MDPIARALQESPGLIQSIRVGGKVKPPTQRSARVETHAFLHPNGPASATPGCSVHPILQSLFPQNFFQV